MTCQHTCKERLDELDKCVFVYVSSFVDFHLAILKSYAAIRSCHTTSNCHSKIAKDAQAMQDPMNDPCC